MSALLHGGKQLLRSQLLIPSSSVLILIPCLVHSFKNPNPLFVLFFLLHHFQNLLAFNFIQDLSLIIYF
jgi:hypothetical protein